MNRTLIALLLIISLFFGCRTEDKGALPSPQHPVGQLAAPTNVNVGCGECHERIDLDTAHRQACTVCHGGVDLEGQMDKAHAGLIPRPAHPERMAAACGGCHPQQVAAASRSRHFTLDNKINTVRRHFGATNLLTTPADIPVASPQTGQLALADDMLRRRCLRCHVYSNGDNYSAVSHGTGCAACHLTFQNGSLKSHAFVLPTDKHCLSCHYGNYVGSDYYGRFEHDFNWEYRTPYTTHTTTNTALRPYGVETHQLAPDIHRQQGLVCIDCHPGSGHVRSKKPTCTSCHGWRPGQPVPPLGTHLAVRNATLILTGRADGREHPVPLMKHPAHRQYGQRVDCQVCHAQWSVTDAPTHLLLSQVAEYTPWERLTVQASSEVERLLEQNLHYSNEFPLTMRDGLTGEQRSGIWYLGYGQRRWEQMLVQRDTDGIIKVFRPILDLRLSLITADGQVPFDNLTGQGVTTLPYTPHTTGPAGLFFRDRFKHLLPAKGK